MSRSAVQSVAVAAKGKGASNLARRARAIGARYGIGPQRMERRLGAVLDIMDRFNCGATLPVTAAAVERNPHVIARYAELGIEFAVHGYYHVDHVGLAPADQVSQLGHARRILQDQGIPAMGFRAPYLRWNEATIDALRGHGFLYDSSQAMNWPIPAELETDAYRRGLTFCDALPATEHPVLPEDRSRDRPDPVLPARRRGRCGPSPTDILGTDRGALARRAELDTRPRRAVHARGPSRADRHVRTRDRGGPAGCQGRHACGVDRAARRARAMVERACRLLHLRPR